MPLFQPAIPDGTAMGQLPVWDHTNRRWLAVANTDGLEPAFYRFTAVAGGDVQARAASMALGFSSAGLLSFTDYGFNTQAAVRHAFVATSDATVTTLISVPITDPSTYHIHAFVSARQTGSTNAAGYERIATMKRAGAAPALVGAVSAAHTAEDVAGWDCTIDSDGVSAARVRVTGAAAVQVFWTGFIVYVPRPGG
jgi:hypothetical protein